MIESLSVKNFILIDDLEINFTNGFCVITGETGSGKSILLDAILLCLGFKSTGNIIKPRKDYAVISISFILNDQTKDFLKESYIEYYDDLLLIKCVQKREGRKNYFINDQVVNKNTMQKLASYLVEIHGQNNNYSLLSSSAHQEILDSFANLSADRLKLSQSFKNWQNILKEIIEITKEKNFIEQEIDYLSFVVEELTKLGVQPYEEEKLINIRKSLQNYEKDLQLLEDISEQINNPLINSAITKAEKLLAKQAQNENFVSIAVNLEDAYNSFEIARERLSSLYNSFNQNEHNLDEIEERLFSIKAASRKYSVPADELQIFLDKSSSQLNILQSKIASTRELHLKEAKAKALYYEIAKDISLKRHKAAEIIEQKVQIELAQLKMAKAIFKVSISNKNEPSVIGIDNVNFIASTNPGTDPGPIDKIASGGELSRFMLALKTSLFDKISKPTIIFDEIDVGIGGEVADKVGERLKKLGSAAQVIVITHQPQVAGKAKQHIKVSKVQLDVQTEVNVKILNISERQQELARMISGKIVTGASLKAAKELLHL